MTHILLYNKLCYIFSKFRISLFKFGVDLSLLGLPNGSYANYILDFNICRAEVLLHLEYPKLD